MRKRYVSALFALCFLLALCPVSAQADGDGAVLVGPIKQIASGGYDKDHHYAVIDANGSLWTWGTNAYGQLGDGTTEDHTAPVKVLDGVSEVSLGSWQSAAIRTDGSLWTWGSNSSGRLGDSTTTDRSAPVKVMDNVVSVSLGFSHSAAIKADGSLWSWGFNAYGELGDGTTTNRSTPVKVMENIASVSLGANYTAAINPNYSRG